MMENLHNTPRHRLAGTALIEVMVSVTILVLGLLGLAAMQARSLMMNQSAYYRSIAVDLGANLAERIHANSSPFLASSDAETQPALPPKFDDSTCTQTAGIFTCSATSGHEAYRAASEMTEWYAFLTSQLPSASYTLSSEAASAAGHYRYTLTITWLDDRSRDSNNNTSYSVVIE